MAIKIKLSEMKRPGRILAIPLFSRIAFDTKSKVKDYLYELHYPCVDYDAAMKYFEKENAEAVLGGCSSLRKDNFFGRNYDWGFNHNAEAIVRIENTDGCCKVGDLPNIESFGVAAGLSEYTNDFAQSIRYSEIYDILPFRLMDGINTKGVFCGVNVVPLDNEPSGEILPTEEEYHHIYSPMIPRFILDHFESADEAIDYLQKHVRITMYKKTQDLGYETHYMVGDDTSGKTYVLEFINNALVAIEADKSTNFYLHGVTFNEDGKVYTPATDPEVGRPSDNGITPHGAGLERYNLIVDNFDTCDTKEGMQEMLNKLQYTRAYKSCVDGASDPYWYSEFAEGSFTVDSTVEEFNAVIPEIGMSVIDYADHEYLTRSRDTGKTWQTVHSSVYNIKDRELYIISQEDGVEYKFSLYNESVKFLVNGEEFLVLGPDGETLQTFTVHA